MCVCPWSFHSWCATCRDKAGNVERWSPPGPTPSLHLRTDVRLTFMTKPIVRTGSGLRGGLNHPPVWQSEELSLLLFSLSSFPSPSRMQFVPDLHALNIFQMFLISTTAQCSNSSSFPEILCLPIWSFYYFWTWDNPPTHPTARIHGTVKELPHLPGFSISRRVLFAFSCQ